MKFRYVKYAQSGVTLFLHYLNHLIVCYIQMNIDISARKKFAMAKKTICSDKVALSEKQDPRTFLFLDLPGELRNTILNFALISPIPVVLNAFDGRGREYYRGDTANPDAPSFIHIPYKPGLEITPAILQVNKAINHEATPILFGKNTFVIDAEYCEPYYRRTLFQSQLSDKLALIRRLVIRLKPSNRPVSEDFLRDDLKRRFAVVENFLSKIEQLRFCTVEIYHKQWGGIWEEQLCFFPRQLQPRRSDKRDIHPYESPCLGKRTPRIMERHSRQSRPYIHGKIDIRYINAEQFTQFVSCIMQVFQCRGPPC